MYGYVRPPLELLDETGRQQFQQAYCGLCHTLGTRYGSAARFILNYDFTYLAILLSDPGEGTVLRRRCIASPHKARPYLQSSAPMELAADESVILAYWQLRDGVSDHDWLHGAKYRAASALLEPAYHHAARLCPSFDTAVQKQLSILSRLEQEQCASMDQAADAFAVLLERGADQVENAVQRRVLGQMLYHLGRWIYLVDAADDLKKDARSGNYNPVALRFGLQNGTWTPESRRIFAQSLDHSVRMIATAYELWDFGRWSPVLEATIYSGLFQVGKAVLDGTFHPKTRGIDRKRRKVEETT
ncbi:DUF5685 family protein [uncultured Oscillibacter sp.]|uniref:DUF5685 family protein n=1 Tax=uncultured Oscillibacter sp. TaxID=876091 RepID=UPI0025E6F81C|nr:DUF5685 family protein [uncultured Oscillibacter sp.]